jgi:lactam utilization protein B
LRSAGRLGAAGAAGEVGYGLGREIDERTGAGKKMVESSEGLKAIAKKMGDSDRVKLSEDSKNRIADMENDQAMREVYAEKKYAKGGSVSPRADGIAQRGKTKGRMC